MSLRDFYPYVETILEKNNGAFYMEIKDKKGEFFIEKITSQKL
jgi:hypothetical protein